MGNVIFESTEQLLTEELQSRIQQAEEGFLSYGVGYLDDALVGISRDDLILVGAPSGIGKTQFCVNLALKNIQRGKRVHFIALEAYRGEIQRRLKYPVIAELYRTQMVRKPLPMPLNFRTWSFRQLGTHLDHLEEPATEGLKNLSLKTLYKTGDFGINELVEAVVQVKSDSDLIIVDHVHYFDFESENENREMKQIVKTVRQINTAFRIPIILVSHLRKRDRRASELVAGGDEFHGSSDLVKIATKVISIGQGGPAVSNQGVVSNTTFDTYFRIVKNRQDGSVTRFVGSCGFSYQTNEYNEKYKVLRLKNLGMEIEEVPFNQVPFWARRFE